MMNDICNVCSSTVNLPKKRLVNGKIVEQCVAKVHDKWLDYPCNSADFLSRAKRSFKKAGVKRIQGGQDHE